MSQLTEDETIDKIEVVPESGAIQVRRARRILRDGVVISAQYHRHVLEPGADLTDEDPQVQAVARAAWGLA